MTTKRPSPSEPADESSKAPIATRTPTKVEWLLAMLKSPDGTSIEELSGSLGWLPHTVRAALTGLRKKGYMIVRRQQGSVTVYRVEP